MTNWQSDLYDCFDDWKICSYGCWCTACLYDENAVQIDGSDYDEACLTYWVSGRSPFGWIPLMDNQSALRNKYGLAEEPYNDCTVIFWCAPCAVCQVARELKIRNNMPGTIQGIIITAQPTNNAVYVPEGPHPHSQTTEPISFIQQQQL